MTSRLPGRGLGNTGLRVSAIGLGCIGMSGMYGTADDTENVATIHAALDAGVTLLDTGDFYGSGHNEMLIARALRDRDRAQVQLSVKFGALRGPNNEWASRPRSCRCAASSASASPRTGCSRAG
jgi:aryl-alcohol dehydrogenase-like predicted oxidoreductase